MKMNMKIKLIKKISCCESWQLKLFSELAR